MDAHDTDRVPDALVAIVNPNSPDAHALRAVVNARESSKPAPPLPSQQACEPGPAIDKPFATMQARYARAGFELVRLADGTLLASRWGMFGALANLDEAEAFLRRAAGPAA
jgi:hypothetical protein